MEQPHLQNARRFWFLVSGFWFLVSLVPYHQTLPARDPGIAETNGQPAIASARGPNHSSVPPPSYLILRRVIHLGSLGDTSIDLDFSFLLLIAFFVFTNLDSQSNIAYALMWAPIVFVSILFHELAHAAAIALLGYGASHIVLTGYGGVTINSRRAKAWQDMVISFAGPAASLLLAFAMFALRRSLPVGDGDPMVAAMLPALLGANIFWGILNLIPVSPLDGGHVVRNLLRMFLQERTAFVIAIWIGMIVGGMTVVISLVLRQFFIALFLAFYVWRNVQLWRDFRRSGMTGE